MAESRGHLAILVLLVFLPGALIVGAGIEHPVILLATDAMMVPLAWLGLHALGATWRDVGLRKPTRVTQLLGVPIGAAMVLAALTRMIRPVVQSLTGEPPDLEAFRLMEGNFPALLAGLVIVWTIAAFGEEMVFRGFLMNAAYRLLPDRLEPNPRWAMTLIISTVPFGFAHAYQGTTGIILTALMGLGFGTVYLAGGRNLWYSILTHGLYDTAGFLLVFFRANPNLAT